MRLLLVEDNRQSARFMQRLLTAAGYEVVHTMYGLEATALARQDSFDAVLLDFDLPDVDGIQVCQMLRLDALALPIIAVTSDSDRITRKKAEAAGFDAFVAKPVHIQELLSTLQVLLGRNYARDCVPDYFGVHYAHHDPARAMISLS